MQTKLTLRLEKELVDFAHFIADKSKDSISNMFATYLKRIKNQDFNAYAQKSSALQKYKGALAHHPKIEKKDLVRLKFGNSGRAH